MTNNNEPPIIETNTVNDPHHQHENKIEKLDESTLKYIDDQILSSLTDETKEVLSNSQYFRIGMNSKAPIDTVYVFGFNQSMIGEHLQPYHNVSGDVITFAKDLEGAYQRFKKMKELLKTLADNKFYFIAVIISRQTTQFFVTMKYIAPSGKSHELRYVEDYSPDNFIPDAFLYDLEKLPSRNQ